MKCCPLPLRGFRKGTVGGCPGIRVHPRIDGVAYGEVLRTAHQEARLYRVRCASLHPIPPFLGRSLNQRGSSRTLLRRPNECFFGQFADRLFGRFADRIEKERSSVGLKTTVRSELRGFLVQASREKSTNVAAPQVFRQSPISRSYRQYGSTANGTRPTNSAARPYVRIDPKRT